MKHFHAVNSIKVVFPVHYECKRDHGWIVVYLGPNNKGIASKLFIYTFDNQNCERFKYINK